MKRGTKATWNSDMHGNTVLTISKQRGKLTLDEIEEILRYEEGQRLCGRYAILLNCSEATVGGNGLWECESNSGDAVDLYPLSEYENCPVCGTCLPPFEYCPNCGVSWKDTSKNIETLMGDFDAIEHHAGTHEKTEADALASFWKYIGALEFARKMGLITAEQMEHLKQRQNTSSEVQKDV